MGYRIKEGFQIMSGGKILTAGCILQKIESDLLYMVEEIEENKIETEKIMIDGLEKIKPVGKDLEPNEQPIMTDVNQMSVVDPEVIRKRGRKPKE